MATNKIILSGGGTGGHVFPAIAIADAIKKKDPSADILFVGAKDKIEMEKVPKAGYPIEGLWISGFHRKLTVRNLLFPFKLLHSILKCRKIVRSFKPDVAVGVGGYASGPLLRVAASKGVATVIQEQNSYAGVTNRILAGKVNKICVAYDRMDRYFPKEKLIVTGNPVRQALFEKQLPREEGIAHFGLKKGKQTIFVFGGSLGAQSINEAMAANTELLKANPQIQVLWQCGKLYYERFKDCATAQLPNVQLQTFIDRMDLAYAMSDVVIGRAGALTIAEICMVEKPAIFIPSPNVAEDHQTKNAMALVDKEAGILVKNSDAKEWIIKRALELLKDKEQLKALSNNIKKLAHFDAADRIADEVLSLAQKS